MECQGLFAKNLPLNDLRRIRGRRARRAAGFRGAARRTAGAGFRGLQADRTTLFALRVGGGIRSSRPGNDRPEGTGGSAPVRRGEATNTQREQCCLRDWDLERMGATRRNRTAPGPVSALARRPKVNSAIPERSRGRTANGPEEAVSRMFRIRVAMRPQSGTGELHRRSAPNEGRFATPDPERVALQCVQFRVRAALTGMSGSVPTSPRPLRPVQFPLASRARPHRPSKSPLASRARPPRPPRFPTSLRARARPRPQFSARQAS